MQAPTITDLTAILPALILMVWGMGLLLVTLVVPQQRRAIIAWLGLLGLGATFATSLLRWDRPVNGFMDAVTLDNYSLFLSAIFAIAGMLTVLLSLHYLRDRGIERGEYYPLLLFSISGMTLMASANDLTVLFIALELLSIPLYVLAGFARPGASIPPSPPVPLGGDAFQSPSGEAEKSEESALKYFLLGAFSSAFLIYGIALVYGGTGTTALPEIVRSSALGAAADGRAMTGNLALVLVGVGLILAGLAFKVAAVPFHMWTPDVYEGAPTPITGFMSVGAKAAGFAALGRIFLLALPSLGDDWALPVAVLAALTMILGNVVALSQDNIKRMLAYSSIAHAGYLLIGVAARSERGLAGLLFYLLAYAFTNLGAFAVLTAMARRACGEQSESKGEDTTFAPYAGLAKRQPWLAAAMALFMFSLTGIPPTGGFVGKYYLFWAAVEADLTWLAVVGVLTSLVSAFFYLRVVVTMYFDAPSHDAPLPFYWTLRTALILTAAGTLIFGLWPGPWLDLAQNSVWAILGPTGAF
jgi:NADH-quinone oxidoreductase subunit N